MTMPQPEVPRVGPEDANGRLDGGALLLDVRNPDEWYAGHPDGATWIPMGEIAARQAELPTDCEILVICKSGGRSARVTEALVAAGYDAANVTGGAEAWQAAGLPIVTDAGQPGTVV